jgi:hypothetical protein
VKTERRQSVGPAQQGATQPARNVAVDDEAPSKMKRLSLSVALLDQTIMQNVPPSRWPGPRAGLGLGEEISE